MLYLGSPMHLCVSHGLLALIKKDTGEETRLIPEDLQLIELDNSQITLTAAALQRLTEANVPVLVTNERHLPASMLLPLVGHTLHQKYLQSQVRCPEATTCVLWRQVVEAKIRNQARTLEAHNRLAGKLRKLAAEVAQGTTDPSQAEAQAARLYWGSLLPTGIRRDPDAEDPLNAYLNYGYAVVRATVARGLVGAGLSPAWGLWHRNQYNPYALADDMMEPYRPAVDRLALQLFAAYPQATDLNRERKAILLRVPMLETRYRQKARQLGETIPLVCATLARCYTNERERLDFPTLWPSLKNPLSPTE